MNKVIAQFCYSTLYYSAAVTCRSLTLASLGIGTADAWNTVRPKVRDRVRARVCCHLCSRRIVRCHRIVRDPNNNNMYSVTLSFTRREPNDMINILRIK